MKCGRLFSWRKKWEKEWNKVKFCSKSCQRMKFQRDWRSLILALIENCDLVSCISMQEILGTADSNDKKLIEEIRMSARLLAHEGKVEIIQNGKKVDPYTFKGEIEIRKSPKNCVLVL